MNATKYSSARWLGVRRGAEVAEVQPFGRDPEFCDRQSPKSSFERKAAASATAQRGPAHRWAVCLVLVFVLGISSFAAFAADPPKPQQDPSRDNLQHAEGAVIGGPPLGRVLKGGRGKQPLLLVSGLGFHGELYEDFLERFEDRFATYAITPAGFGGTAALAMPATGTSYGEQTWIRRVVEGLGELIEGDGLQQPLVVTHLGLGAQIGLRPGPRPSAASGRIGPHCRRGDPAVGACRLQEADRGGEGRRCRPALGSAMVQDGNPGNLRCRHVEAAGLQPAFPASSAAMESLARVPLPVMVRYLCEFLASDVAAELSGLATPTLVVAPGGTDEAAALVQGETVERFFVDPWQGLAEQHRRLELVTVENSGLFLMDDQPQELRKVIEGFAARAFGEVRGAEGSPREEPPGNPSLTGRALGMSALGQRPARASKDSGSCPSRPEPDGEAPSRSSRERSPGCYGLGGGRLGGPTDPHALGDGDLRRLAQYRLGGEGGLDGFEATALVHEIYLHLADKQRPNWRDRRHFFSVAALIMRRILVDAARRRMTAKHGAGATRVELEEGIAQSSSRVEELLALDRALERLDRFDARP